MEFDEFDKIDIQEINSEPMTIDEISHLYPNEKLIVELTGKRKDDKPLLIVRYRGSDIFGKYVISKASGNKNLRYITASTNTVLNSLWRNYV